jgi:carbon storage regulator CsrA
MLVIRRRESESVMIGEVEVRVLEIAGSRVKLGFVGGKEVAIVRREVAETGEVNRRAAQAAVRDNASVVSSIFR